MQEQNSEKVVSLSVRATKVTANVLKSAVRAYLSAQKNKSPKVYKGKQSVKHLIQKGEKLTNIEVTRLNRQENRLSYRLCLSYLWLNRPMQPRWLDLTDAHTASRHQSTE